MQSPWSLIYWSNPSLMKFIVLNFSFDFWMHLFLLYFFIFNDWTIKVLSDSFKWDIKDVLSKKRRHSSKSFWILSSTKSRNDFIWNTMLFLWSISKFNFKGFSPNLFGVEKQVAAFISFISLMFWWSLNKFVKFIFLLNSTKLG